MVGWNAFIFRNQFPDPEKFIPERWLENKKEICPHAVRQFSHGPRMCIGKSNKNIVNIHSVRTCLN